MSWPTVSPSSSTMHIYVHRILTQWQTAMENELGNHSNLEMGYGSLKACCKLHYLHLSKLLHHLSISGSTKVTLGFFLPYCSKVQVAVMIPLLNVCRVHIFDSLTYLESFLWFFYISISTCFLMNNVVFWSIFRSTRIATPDLNSGLSTLVINSNCDHVLQKKHLIVYIFCLYKSMMLLLPSSCSFPTVPLFVFCL